jgi:NitT/TauT family transport system permease protein
MSTEVRPAYFAAVEVSPPLSAVADDTLDSGSDRRVWVRRSLAALIVIAIFAVLAAGWEWVAYTQDSVLPKLGAVLHELTSRPHFYWTQLQYTLITALEGTAIGVSVALVLAVIVVHAPLVRSAVMPIAILIHATPVIAIAPALVVAFGFGRVPHLIVVALLTFFPMLINAISGLRTVPEDVMEVFDSMAASKWEILVRLRLPGSLRFLFAAAKTCVTLGMVGSIVSEFQGATIGLGATIVTATTYLNLAQMWAAIALAALTSLVLLGAVSIVERFVIRW